MLLPSSADEKPEAQGDETKGLLGGAHVPNIKTRVLSCFYAGRSSTHLIPGRLANYSGKKALFLGVVSIIQVQCLPWSLMDFI